jgi:hypothetical protein
VGRYGVQSRGDDVRPGESCSGRGAMACPVLKQGGFKGEGVVVDRASPGGLVGAVDSGPYRVQWQAWRRPVPASPHSARVVVAVRGVALQGQGWLHRTNSDGDGAPAGLSSWFDPAEQRREGSRARPAPPLRARCVSRTKVGGTVSRS